MDLSWSPDGKMIVSGSIDNSAIVWEIKTGNNMFCVYIMFLWYINFSFEIQIIQRRTFNIVTLAS